MELEHETLTETPSYYVERTPNEHGKWSSPFAGGRIDSYGLVIDSKNISSESADKNLDKYRYLTLENQAQPCFYFHSPSTSLPHCPSSSSSITQPIPISLSSQFSIKCSSTPTPEPLDPSFPIPSSKTTLPPESFPIEKRRRSEIIQDPKSRTELTIPEPPSSRSAWKRTKEIKLEKPKGYVIADFLESWRALMGKEFGSTELLAKAGEIVTERAREGGGGALERKGKWKRG
ncbi:hypothetical protein F8388_020415 [Cannabis sativa]|uniref:Uncharacterized protein n=1 Tax=Cannabis sativa TaxID=3483 RepID=A0A7J6HJF3_CANSA|nr:hypothetical protein F8388_020415 [Cannabis sativa]